MATDRLSIYWPDNLKPKAKASGNKWPKGYDPELDDVEFKPVDLPYRVLSKHGCVLGTFWDRVEALTAYARWEQAVMVVFGNEVIQDARGRAA